MIMITALLKVLVIRMKIMDAWIIFTSSLLMHTDLRMVIMIILRFQVIILFSVV